MTISIFAFCICLAIAAIGGILLYVFFDPGERREVQTELEQLHSYIDSEAANLAEEAKTKMHRALLRTSQRLGLP